MRLDREETFGPDRCEFMWCLHCERAYKREDFRLVGNLQMCPYPDCDGDTVIDAWPWDRVKTSNSAYPEKPKIGKPYPLYRSAKTIDAEFDWFRQVSKSEGGLIAKTQAALVLGVSKQRVGDLVAEKRLRQHDFFGKEFISCKDLEVFRRTERKTGRPRTGTEKVDERKELTKDSPREYKRPPAPTPNKQR